MERGQVAYWDKVAPEKEFSTPFQIELFSTYVSKNARILDVGCGYGRTLSELHANGYTDIHGIDTSKKMIERGAAEYPFLDLKVTSGQGMEFEDNSFDVVILLAVLTCIPDDTNQDSLISEIKRVLKPGGIIYINDFMLNTDERNINRYRKFEDKYNKYGIFELPEGAVLKHHSEERVRELTASFDDIAFEKVVYTTMNGNKSNGFYYIGKNKKK